MSFYSNAHSRVRRLWGSARQYRCVGCGGRAHSWAYDGTDPTAGYSHSTRCEFSEWPEFYMPMCLACHRDHDVHWHERAPRHKKRAKVKVLQPRTEAEWDEWLKRR